MRKLSLLFILFSPLLSFGQLIENFSDGDFTDNPTWTGNVSNFFVNNSFQLQSKAPTTSTSFLFTPSEAIDDAVWEVWVKITYTTSSSNYASVYIVSSTNDVTNGCNGYFVKIGDTKDNVSLWLQEGTKKTKLIDGVEKRTEGNLVEIKIKVTRDENGNFSLYSKLPPENDYFLEGTIQNLAIKQSLYFGLMYANTSTTGSAYYFDDILVTGNKALDTESPQCEQLTLLPPNQLKLQFSEPMDFSQATFILNEEMGTPSNIEISADKIVVMLTFENEFQRGKIYILEINEATDLSGNPLLNTTKITGITEPIEMSDLVFNEIMFDNPPNSTEYIEIFNRSEKLLDVSGIVFTTRKKDGNLNTGHEIPKGTLLKPAGYLAVCPNADSLLNYYHYPPESYVVTTSWSSLNNESAIVVLTNNNKDTIYDELTYSVKWHHIMIKNPQGVSLEKINPSLPSHDPQSWHSAAFEVNYGTPGYKNSQYREIDISMEPEEFIWADPEAFSPDNDGMEDVCLIHYKTATNGFVATATIFNAVGVKVCQLLSNVLLASEGFFLWDGKTSDGKIANPGIYVLYFEMIQPGLGIKKQAKIPIVVSLR